MGRPKSTHCLRGHEIAKVGRYSSGMCRACKLGTDQPAVYEPGVRGRKPRLVCIRGHVIAQVGRYIHRGKNKGCLACHRERAFVHHEAIRAERRKHSPVPPGPLMALIRKVGINEFADIVAPRMGITPESVQRLIHRCSRTGFTIRAADELCVAMGYNPSEIYGSAWFAFGEEEVARAV